MKKLLNLYREEIKTYKEFIDTVTNTTSVPDVSIDTTAGTTSIIK